MKIFFRRVHLYLAFSAGLVFLVQCLTGTVLVFEDEITHALYAGRYTVAVPAAQPRQSLAVLADHLRQLKPKSKLLGFTVYADPARTVELTYREAPARPDDTQPAEGRGFRNKSAAPRSAGADKPRGRPERGNTAFLNPYSGQVVGLLDRQDRGIFKVAEDVHRRLLAGEVGKALTGLSALFILVITATGVVLWWPKTWALLTGRLRIRWSGSGKRITHDLHVVLGFYCAPFLFGLALTGVIMSYRWAAESLFRLTGTRPTVGIAAPRSAFPGSPRMLAYDAALRTGQQVYRTAEFWRVGAPKDSAAAISISAPSTLTWRAAGLDTLFADRSTGAALGQHLYSRQSAGAQLRRLAKPLHTGAIGGAWTKGLALVVVLCSLTFPVTGVLLWLNRTRRKQPKKTRTPVAV
ncbi:PepSY-associated TM helix domain-containing protein [Hymenobacter sp. BRD67]|uniref:PepSY-associated TM helix domain-containing protein n=1 Tax=Hymenobacter sp. BRD67 TaxID=2675877 RepID=UPI0015673138|nr:PepSY-associated TM helix domain-containing protein [Hymenobacter sp. BRD67]QKG53828.1 PepSY domain-containing protein [Hymenobacter sp. BRD67]